VGPNHQHTVRSIKNKRSNGWNRTPFLHGLSIDTSQAHTVSFQDCTQFSKMLNNHVRSRHAKLLNRVIPGQHSAGVNAAMPRCLNVVLHIPDEQGFRRRQRVRLKYLVNLLPLVVDADVRHVNILVKASGCGLRYKVRFMNGAQEKRSQVPLAAKLQEFPGVWQFANRILDLPKTRVKPLFELVHRNVRNVLVVKDRKRKAEFRAECVQGYRFPARLLQDVVGRLPHRRQVVHQSA